MILRKNGFRDILQFYMKYIYNGILARKFPLFLLDDEEKDALISKEKAEFDDYYYEGSKYVNIRINPKVDINI